MATTGPKLVHKQFNSPFGLYSQQNIQDTLSRHIQHLGNGAQGIDFSSRDKTTPANLANSKVLQALEEEEREKRGKKRSSRFENFWPPPPRLAEQLAIKYRAFTVQHSKDKKVGRKVVWPPVPEYQEVPSEYPQQPQINTQPRPAPQTHQIPVQHQYPGTQYHQNKTVQPLRSPTQQYLSQHYGDNTGTNNYTTASCEGRKQEQAAINRLVPINSGRPVQSHLQGSTRWAPVSAPQTPQQSPGYNPRQQTGGYQQQMQQQYAYQYNNGQDQYSTQQHYTTEQAGRPFSPAQHRFEPPPSMITLRAQAPIHQKPSPVFPSQPAAASYQGGPNKRGDQKWPPQSVKEAVVAENQARIQLAKGPACRPRKVKKDYADFFAKNALNKNYVGYHVPPGTQHFYDHSGSTAF